MKMLHAVAMVLTLFVAFGTAQAQDGRRGAELQAEAGGWQAAYGNELSEHDMEAGEVQPGVSIFAARGTAEMEQLHDWANALLQEAASRAGVGEMDQSERFQAMRFVVRTVRELIRSRRSGSEQTELGSVEVKAGLLEHRGRSWGGGRRAERVFVPYVGMKGKFGGGSPWGGAQQEPYNPSQQPTIQSAPDWRNGPSSAEMMSSFSLKNTSRSIGGGRWQWTAYIDGPERFLRRISSVTYYLHPSFKPSTQRGDSSRPGHPLTATGWGVFVLRAEVALDDGTRRIYEHPLRFR